MTFNKWKIHTLFFSLSLCLCGLINFDSSAIAGQKDRAGTNAGNTLRISPSAAASAMGDAYTAAGQGEVESLHYNPAGLAWSTKRQVAGTYQNMILDVGQGTIGYLQPINEKSGWGILPQYVDFGTTQRTLVSGTAGVNAGNFSGHDLAIGLSYGAQFGEGWAYGVTAKAFSSQIDDVTATAIAGDLGLMWRPVKSNFALGFALKNFGSTVKYEVATERLPLVFRGGGEWTPFKAKDGSSILRVTADIEKVSREGISGFFGAEYTFAKMLSIRVGYDGALSVDNGLTVGGGVNIKDFELDYAYVPFGDVGNNHRVGLEYSF